jgi:hypothetical protein
MFDWLQGMTDTAFRDPAALFLGVVIGLVIGFLVGLSSSRLST